MRTIFKGSNFPPALGLQRSGLAGVEPSGAWHGMVPCSGLLGESPKAVEGWGLLWGHSPCAISEGVFKLCVA